MINSSAVTEIASLSESQAVLDSELAVPSPVRGEHEFHNLLIKSILDQPITKLLESVVAGGQSAKRVVTTVRKGLLGNQKEDTQIDSGVLASRLEKSGYKFTVQDLLLYQIHLIPLLQQQAREAKGARKNYSETQPGKLRLEQVPDADRLIVLHQFLQDFSETQLTALFAIVDIQLRSVATQAELLALIAHLKERADRDPLTSLLNRRGLMSWIVSRAAQRAQEKAQADKEGKAYEPKKILIVQFDIDYFHTFNNFLGHSTGDDVLKILSHILKNTFRSSDGVVRYGGEEFSILIELDTQALLSEYKEKLKNPDLSENEAIFAMLQEKFQSVNDNFFTAVSEQYGTKVDEAKKGMSTEEKQKLDTFSISAGVQYSDWDEVLGQAAILAAEISAGAIRPTLEKLGAIRAVIAQELQQEAALVPSALNPDEVRDELLAHKEVGREQVEAIPIESILQEISALEQLVTAKVKKNRDGVTIEMLYELIVTTVFLKIFNRQTSPGDKQLMDIAKKVRHSMAFLGEIFTHWPIKLAAQNQLKQDRSA